MLKKSYKFQIVFCPDFNKLRRIFIACELYLLLLKKKQYKSHFFTILFIILNLSSSNSLSSILKSPRFRISKKFLSNLTFGYFSSFKNLKDPEFQYFHESYLLLLLTLINNNINSITKIVTSFFKKNISAMIDDSRSQ